MIPRSRFCFIPPSVFLGEDIFYFAVDGTTDGLADGTWMDSVQVAVE